MILEAGLVVVLDLHYFSSLNETDGIHLAIIFFARQLPGPNQQNRQPEAPGTFRSVGKKQVALFARPLRRK